MLVDNGSRFRNYTVDRYRVIVEEFVCRMLIHVIMFKDSSNYLDTFGSVVVNYVDHNKFSGIVSNGVWSRSMPLLILRVLIFVLQNNLQLQ